MQLGCVSILVRADKTCPKITWVSKLLITDASNIEAELAVFFKCYYLSKITPVGNM